MPSIYRILSEFTDDPEPDRISVSPFWVVAVIRYAQPLTFSRTKMFAGQQAANHTVDADSIVQERPMLVLSDDIASMTVSHSKGSYVSSLQATLVNGEFNYLTEIQPNDWVMAWIVNNEDFGRELIGKIRNRHPANGFMDGLKFIGKAQSIRKTVQQAPNGIRTVHYQLQAAGFKEFDASIFFDPALSKEDPSMGQWLTGLDIKFNEFFGDAVKGIQTTLAIPQLLKILIGEGVPPFVASPGGVDVVAGGTATPQAPYCYVMPASVMKLLGQSNQAKAVPSYSDVLELIIGVQKYDNQGATAPEDLFGPVGARKDTNHKTLNDDLLGSFQPMPVAFNGRSVWNVLESFRNPAINEMYTTLRISIDGRVVPTLIVRQLPFSTALAEDTEDSYKITFFHELPRWYCDPILINSFDIGKTESLRMNFIHVYGQPSMDAGVPTTVQILQNLPIRDDHDIKRNGLAPHMQTVNCSVGDTFGEPRKWMRLMSDWLVGQQFTLTGSCHMIGIQAPICIGDNFELDDTVYHIESVTHSCSINSGFKQFGTAVTLTHGVRSDLDPEHPAAVQKTATVVGRENGDNQIGSNEDFSIYSGTKPSDCIGYDPGQTVDSRTASQLQNESTEAGAVPNSDGNDSGGIA